jgi:hypothetical protein
MSRSEYRKGRIGWDRKLKEEKENARKEEERKKERRDSVLKKG